jgi:hypothetical protein
MYDEDESVSIAVNVKRVHNSGRRGAVSREMLVMRSARALGKLGGCSHCKSWAQCNKNGLPSMLGLVAQLCCTGEPMVIREALRGPFTGQPSPALLGTLP